MIIFLFGPDTYRSKQKLNKLKEKFVKKNGGKNANISVLDFENLDLNELRKNFLSHGLFSEKRLIIVNGLLSTSLLKKNLEEKENLFEEIKKIIKGTKKDNVFIFWDREIDEKKLTPTQKQIFQFLKKESFCEEFKFLTPAETKKWIKKYLIEQKIQIESAAVDFLFEIYSHNLWALHNELDKIIAWNPSSKNNLVKLNDIKKIIISKFEQNIWQFIDALGQRKKSLALKILADLLEQDIDVGKIIALIAYQCRIIIRIKFYLEKQKNSKPNNYQLAKELAIHPFACQKALKQEKNYSLEELKKIYQQLLETDFLRKTKKIDPQSLLDLLIVNS